MAETNKRNTSVDSTNTSWETGTFIWLPPQSGAAPSMPLNKIHIVQITGNCPQRPSDTTD